MGDINIPRYFPGEREAIDTVLAAGAAHGYGNMIQQLSLAWSKMLQEKWGLSPEAADRSAFNPEALLKFSEQQANDRIRELEAELQRVKSIGQQFERDMRSHFEQSCKNLERATTAEAEVVKLREAVRVLGQEVEYSRLVLNEVKKQRTYEAANRLVPGGCVSSAMETYCARLIAGRVLVDTNPIAAAAIVVSEVVPARVRRQYDALEAKLKEPH